MNNPKFPKLRDDTEYIRPKKTITDLLQNKEEIEKKLEGFHEVTGKDINNGELVRYIIYSMEKKKELFRMGGVIVYNADKYIMIRGKNNLVFPVKKYLIDSNGNIIYYTRFFKKLNNIDLFKNDVQKILEKNNELIKKQTKIIQTLQKEVDEIKKL